MGDTTRRRLIQLGGTAVIGGLAGCISDEPDETDGQDTDDDTEQAQTATESTPAEATADSDTPAEDTPAEPAGQAIEYTWETGRPESWATTGPVYDESRAEFTITDDNPISGAYSAQTIALNNAIDAYDPGLVSDLRGETVASVSGQFRLDGDLDANEQNYNSFVLQNEDRERTGSVVFYHGNRELRWSVDSDPAQNDSPRVLETFSPGEVYDITITPDGETFTVTVNGTEHTYLPSERGQRADIGQVLIDSQNSTGISSSLYDGPIYFTWDNIEIEIE